MTRRSLNFSLTIKRSLIAVSALLGLELFTAVPVSQGATNYYFNPSGTGTLGGNGVWDAGTTADWSTTASGGSDVVWPNTNSYASIFEGTAGTVTVAAGGVITNGLSVVLTGTQTFTGGPVIFSGSNSSINYSNVGETVVFNSDVDATSSLSTSSYHGGTALTLNNVVETGATAATLSLTTNSLSAPQSILGNITASNGGSLNLVINGSSSSSTSGPPAQPTTSGTFTLNGNNTALLSTNSTTIGGTASGGDVVLNNANALGASAVKFAAGPAFVAGTYNAYEASLETGTAGLTIANNITVNAETNANNAHVYNIGSNASVTSGTTVFSGNIINNNTVQAVNLLATKVNTITQFSGVLSGSAFATAVGAGTISLTGPNTFTGGLSVMAGSTLSLDNATTLAAATGTTTVAGALTSTVANASLGGSLGLGTGGTISPNGSSVGALTLASTRTFTMSAGTLSINIASAGSYDQLSSSGGAGATFTITGGTLNLNLGTANSAIYSSDYQILNGFASGSVSGLSITNYDSTDYTASLNNLGVLSFGTVPEASTGVMMLIGLAFLGLPAWRALRKVRQSPGRNSLARQSLALA